ncbi:MAG TPA: hypothetical protein DCR93_33545 [Cytophagales bacterium]|nr:hypothetical protein [Cytophagales bacterium]
MSHFLFWKQRYQKLYAENIDRLRNFFFYGCGDLAESELMAENVMWHMRHYGKFFSKREAQKFLFLEARLMAAQIQFEPGKPITFLRKYSFATEDFHFAGDHHVLKEKLETAFSVLPIRLRQIFLLHRIDKLSPAQIAHTLGLPLGQVEDSLVEALDRLNMALREAS